MGTEYRTDPTLAKLRRALSEQRARTEARDRQMRDEFVWLSYEFVVDWRASSNLRLAVLFSALALLGMGLVMAGVELAVGHFLDPSRSDSYWRVLLAPEGWAMIYLGLLYLAFWTYLPHDSPQSGDRPSVTVGTLGGLVIYFAGPVIAFIVISCTRIGVLLLLDAMPDEPFSLYIHTVTLAFFSVLWFSQLLKYRGRLKAKFLPDAAA